MQRGLGSGRRLDAGSRRPHRPRQARHGHHADPGPQTDGCRDGRRVVGRPLERARDPRPGPKRSPGAEGWYGEPFAKPLLRTRATSRRCRPRWRGTSSPCSSQTASKAPGWARSCGCSPAGFSSASRSTSRDGRKGSSSAGHRQRMIGVSWTQPARDRGRAGDRRRRRRGRARKDFTVSLLTPTSVAASPSRPWRTSSPGSPSTWVPWAPRTRILRRPRRPLPLRGRSREVQDRYLAGDRRGAAEALPETW